MEFRIQASYNLVRLEFCMKLRGSRLLAPETCNIQAQLEMCSGKKRREETSG